MEYNQNGDLLFDRKSETGLELDHLSFSFLFTTDFEVFAPFDRQLLPELALRALHPEDDFLCRFGLLPENGLCLSTITTLFAIVSALSLSENGFFSLFVLGHLMQRVLLALALAEGFTGLRNVHHVVH
jgi:hypothetical protein